MINCEKACPRGYEKHAHPTNSHINHIIDCGLCAWDQLQKAEAEVKRLKVKNEMMVTLFANHHTCPGDWGLSQPPCYAGVDDEITSKGCEQCWREALCSTK